MIPAVRVTLSPGPWAMVKLPDGIYVVDCNQVPIAKMLREDESCEGDCRLMADAHRLATAAQDALEYLPLLANERCHPETSVQAVELTHALDEVGML